MKKVIFLFCLFSLLFAENYGFLAKGTEMRELSGENARHFSNGDGTIRAVIEAKDEGIEAVDTLLASYSGTSELLFQNGLVSTAVRYDTAIYCGYYGGFFPYGLWIWERGWVEWNVSSIHDSAIIDSVKCQLYCSNFFYEAPWKVELYHMRHRPNGPANAETLYNDAGDGNFYGKDTLLTANMWRTCTLNYLGRNDLKSRLVDDWFAIGLRGYGPTGSNSWEVRYDPHSHLTRKPRLLVYYRLPRDVGVTEIITPTGTIDSAASITPACSVYNFGANTVSYTVRMKVGTFFTTTATVSGHSPGTKLYLPFLPTIAHWPRGTHTVSCSTELVTDMNRTNDKKAGTLTVRVRDVGLLSIVLPPSLDSGTSFTPACTVYNFGTTPEGPYSVRLKIGDFYNHEGMVNSHNPGEKLYLTFPPFSNWPRGSHLVSCSTELVTDLNPINDRKTHSLMVYVSDVGVSKIVAPTKRIDSGSVVTPVCSVYNYGNRSEAYEVRLKIGSFYNRTASVSNHSPGSYQEVIFPDWPAREVGTHVVSCSTELTRDMIRGNDKKTDSVIVLPAMRDVGVESIVRPYVYESQGPIRPKALVKNYGATEEGFLVYFRINIHLGNQVYADSQLVSLPPDSSIEIEFAEWPATGPILYMAKCSTALSGDNNSGNDAKGRIFLVEPQIYDVGVLAISQPAGEISPGPVRPKAKVYNYGRYPESFFTYFKIYAGDELVYSDSSYVSEIYPNEARDVLFEEWNATVGEYIGQCSTALTNDQNNMNDRQRNSFRVRIPTRGWIFAGEVPVLPDGKKMKSGSGMTECGGKLYILKGNNTRSLYYYLPGSSSAIYEDSVPLANSGKKVKKGSGITSDGERFLYLFKGSGTKEFFRYDTQGETTWQELPAVLGEKSLKGGTGVCYLFGFIYLLKGSNTNEFYRFNIAGRSWEQLVSPPRTKGFKDGSCLLAHQGKIYLLGNNYNNFYTYSPSANSWDTLKPMPLYHPQVNKKKKVKEGAALTAKGNKIFAFKGGNTGEFWVYDLVEDVWIGLETIPKGTERKQVKGGGALWAWGEEVWALKGNNTTSIWKYIGSKGEREEGLSWREMPGAKVKGQNEKRKLELRGKVFIFSNPTKGRAKVYYHLPKGERVIREIYNVLGKLIHKEEVDKGEFRVEKLPAGVYLLRLTDKDNKKKEERKLIVVK